MTFCFAVLTAALACINIASGFKSAAPAYPTCPKPVLPEIVPIVVQSQAGPAPAVFGPQKPEVIEHISAPYEMNYYEKPWIVKHKQGASLSVFSQAPVVVDEFAAPTVLEAAAPPAIIVETVTPAPPGTPSAPSAPAPCH